MILHRFTSSSEGATSFERLIVILLIPLNNNCKKIIKKNYYPLKKLNQFLHLRANRNIKVIFSGLNSERNVQRMTRLSFS